jgi:hypothetical protein
MGNVNTSENRMALAAGASQPNKVFTSEDIGKILRQRTDKRNLKEERRARYYHYITRKDKMLINNFTEYQT